MLYLSQVLSRPIRDLEGERVASIKDVVIRLGEDDHPPVTGFVARYRRRDFFLGRWRTAEFGEQGVRLNSDILDLRPFVRRAGEVLLARDVLDKQLVDVDGKRVVRVNDVQIIEAAGEWRVTFVVPTGTRSVNMVINQQRASLTGTVINEDGEFPLKGRVADDQVLQCLVADSNTRVAAKLVDLDSEQQMVSEIWGLEVRICTADGTFKVLDGKGKELLTRKGTLTPAAAPDLTPDTKELVVLALPYRTRDGV